MEHRFTAVGNWEYKSSYKLYTFEDFQPLKLKASDFVDGSHNFAVGSQCQCQSSFYPRREGNAKSMREINPCRGRICDGQT